ncbi:Ras guanine nucleotide exchange factor, putative [Entamoeba histolytica HM-1:IMSS-B]|uniref:Ras guanine nucleotide exchange factor, putative n=6 Tax=Entamoeba histolytica TaxID=5759 RepID=C4M7T7_ENTH1|nr:Ras guanine nucleotide exchange factor, putative [Entamoeba histolytica HM-1:IMSS]EMD43079.1 Ras guanine nucleotide exchange factor, putative [Entamoeba histolytica KU27]EMH74859.1 Ras guanine nucleotide exchange factor, putative [Entamoeba histolytica HM-1:IMSS-B]EMS12476.1 Ras guanine nucleotide exchange factor, putative [Entamoeba histolytica HM-3:IMSS]ENY64401.1 Ras guanine nucleotide exchange factor, putative [Entamoeba histolytica HM-1:IMSS-A]GAT97617.1 Ras guanine nucleotide exchange|eukprot:XP_649186.1 Ras guanine nucleotide exchange factor, putative [Entamoeba histolytica HM-1:IMSS]
MSGCPHKYKVNTECPRCKQSICAECFSLSVKEHSECPVCKSPLTVALLIDLCHKEAIPNFKSVQNFLVGSSIPNRKRCSVSLNADVSKLPGTMGSSIARSTFSGMSDTTLFIDESTYQADDNSNIFEQPDSPEFITFTKEKGWDFPIIQTATLPKMIQVITSKDFQDPYFAECLVFGYPTVMTKEELIGLLVKRFNPQRPEGMNWDEFVSSKLSPIRMKVMGFIRSWVNWRFSDFDDIDMRTTLELLIGMYETFKPKMAKFMKDFIDKQEKKTQTHIREFTLGNEAKYMKDFIEEQPIFSFSIKDVAQQITLMQFDKFRRITVDELLSQMWTKKDNKTLTPNIVAMMQLTNKISYIVQNIILSFVKLKYRIFAIEFFIKVAEYLKKLNNFDGFKAILAALDSSAIYRLKDTKDGLSEESIKLLTEFQSIVNYESNFKKLREITAICEPPCIPFLGSTLGDLVFTKENEKSENGQLKLVNFFRVRTYGSMLREIVMKQGTSFPFYYCKNLKELIEQFEFEENEDKLFEKSINVEPTRNKEISKEDKKKINKAKGDVENLWKKYHSFWKKTMKIEAVVSK